jgi:hypothetical protein
MMICVSMELEGDKCNNKFRFEGAKVRWFEGLPIERSNDRTINQSGKTSA